MEYVVITVLLVVVAGVALWVVLAVRARSARALAGARADARRRHEQLGAAIPDLTANDEAANDEAANDEAANDEAANDEAVKQMLADAGERHTTAGEQLARATTVRQFELAGETALEGLHYVRAVRIAMGLHEGSPLPATEAQRVAGSITAKREVEVRGERYRVGPRYGTDTPCYYPGGDIGGRKVPAGWYDRPWWKTALVAGGVGIGAVLLMDALFSPASVDPGHDAQ